MCAVLIVFILRTLGEASCFQSFDFWRWCRALQVLAVLLTQVTGWVLVSREGEVTLLGPVDIDPSYTLDPRLRFRVLGSAGLQLFIGFRGNRAGSEVESCRQSLNQPTLK